MPNQEIRRVLNVFLASPGDVTEERRIARDVINELNETLGRVLQWHIVLLGWERTLPGYGRAQEIIDRDVDQCDLFIGLLSRRFGQPTGQHGSGFEEEYERARVRRERTKTPEIWLFFKRVPPEQLADPGDELKRVLLFRKRVEKEVFFKEVTNPGDWRTELQRDLTQYIARLAIQSLQPTQSPPIRAETLAQPTVTVHQEAATEPGNRQIAELLTSLTEAINRGGLDIAEEQIAPLDEFHLARLNILATTYTAKLYPTTVLGTHEVNLVYQYRHQTELTPREREILFRSLVADTHDIVPGWYWLRERDESSVLERVILQALVDANADVRTGAIKLVTSAHIQPPNTLPRDKIFYTLLSHTEEQVRKATLKYLETVGIREDIPIIERALNDQSSTVSEQAVHARLVLLARTAPIEEVFIYLNVALKVSNFIIAELRKRSSTISSDLLLEAIRHSDSEMRLFALEELARRSELPVTTAHDLLKDSSVAVKELCYRVLIKHGQEIDPNTIRESFKREGDPQSLGFLLGPPIDVDDVILEVYRSRNLDRLVEEIDWYSINGPIAYGVLALDHFPRFKQDIRDHLDQNFQQIKNTSNERLKAKYGLLADSVIEEFNEKKLDEIVQTRFTAAALAAIAEHGYFLDIVLGRKYRDHPDQRVQREAIKIINRHGDFSDAEVLIQIAKSSYGEMKKLAAMGALKLWAGIDGTASRFLESEDPQLVKLSIQAIWDQDSPKIQQFLMPYLGSSDLRTRMNVLAYFTAKCNPNQLERMIMTYMEGDTYFYNVVCWLDRVVYAPLSFQEMFRQLIKATLS